MPRTDSQMTMDSRFLPSAVDTIVVRRLKGSANSSHHLERDYALVWKLRDGGSFIPRNELSGGASAGICGARASGANGHQNRSLSHRASLQQRSSKPPFPPWSAELQPNYYVIRDANKQQLAYVYFENEPGRRSAAKLLSKDEASDSGY